MLQLIIVSSILFLIVDLLFTYPISDGTSDTSDTSPAQDGYASSSCSSDTQEEPSDSEDDEEEEEDKSLVSRLVDAYPSYLICKMLEHDYTIHHAVCGKCPYCRYSHDEERDSFTSTYTCEVYTCTRTHQQIDKSELYDERYCPYYEE